MNDELDDLLRAADAKESANASAEAEDQKQRVLNGQRATSAFGVLASRGWWFLAGSIAFVSVAMSVMGGLDSHTHGNRAYEFPVALVMGGGLGVAAALFAMTLLADGLVKAAYAREVAWVAGLPFKLENHLSLFTHERGTFRLQFVEAGPDEATLEKLLRGVSCASLELEIGTPLRIEVRGERNSSARSTWRAWRGVVDQLLLPLHRTYPIAAVSFE